MSKPATILSGGGVRKPSLDDVSGDEIDAWLVSDESRPTPDRPSGVYGGDTITLATYNGKDKPKAPAEPTRPAAATPAAKPMPPVPVPVPVAATPPPAPAPVAPPVVVTPPVVATLPSPPVVVAPVPVAAAPPPPVEVIPAPAPAPVPVPVVAVAKAEPKPEGDYFNPLFNFLSDAPDVVDVPTETGDGSNHHAAETGDDGIADLSSLQDDPGDANDPGTPMPEEYVDESNPFYVKKKVETQSSASGKPAPGAADSSSAAGDVLRKLLDRKRASKS